jgi:hypothetical protein
MSPEERMGNAFGDLPAIWMRFLGGCTSDVADRISAGSDVNKGSAEA